MGFKVHDTVNSLTVLGSGVKDAGLSVQSGFSSAAGAVGGIPFVGGKVSDALQSAGRGSGGNVAALGQSGVDKVNELARLLGLIVFALPTVIVLRDHGAAPRPPDPAVGSCERRPRRHA